MMEVKFLTSKTTSPGVLHRVGNRLVSSRPTILVMIISVVNSLAAQVPIYCPSRMMVTSSEILRISSILWEMYTMETPFARSSSTMVKSASTSCSGERRGGLVQNQDLTICGNCLGDFHQLHLRHG